VESRGPVRASSVPGGELGGFGEWAVVSRVSCQEFDQFRGEILAAERVRFEPPSLGGHDTRGDADVRERTCVDRRSLPPLGRSGSAGNVDATVRPRGSASRPGWFARGRGGSACPSRERKPSIMDLVEIATVVGASRHWCPECYRSTAAPCHAGACRRRLGATAGVAAQRRAGPGEVADDLLRATPKASGSGFATRRDRGRYSGRPRRAVRRPGGTASRLTGGVRPVSAPSSARSFWPAPAPSPHRSRSG
jgi:hypothetical protein